MILYTCITFQDRSGNFRAHYLSKWTATNPVFESIANTTLIFSSIRINTGNYPNIYNLSLVCNLLRKTKDINMYNLI